MKNKIFIGVVGQIACGKGELVRLLTKKYQFISFSLSAIVHNEVKKRKIKHFNRQTLQDIGDELRKKRGNEVLAKEAIKLLNRRKERRFIIEGIRNPAEIEYLRKMFNFSLIGIRARRKIRFQRVLKRNKPWDPKKWNEFLKVDRRDLGFGQNKSGQQVGQCMAYADYVLTNNNEVRTLEKKLGKIINKLRKKYGF